MSVTFLNEGVEFTEKRKDYHIFVAVVFRKDNGKGDLVPCMAPDMFNAMIMAGMIGEVRFIVSLEEMLTVLRNKLYGPNQRDDYANDQSWGQHPGNM